jgi:hypothetical protein
MDRIDLIHEPRPTLAQDRRTSRHRIGAMAAFALMVATALVTTALLVSNAGRTGHAIAAHSAAPPPLLADQAGLARGGGWQFYTPLY